MRPVRITYRDLTGIETTGTIWSPGPHKNTVWVLTADGKAVVVHTGSNTQIDYTPLRRHTDQADRQRAQQIIADHHESQQFFLQLGLHTTPCGPDYEWAVATLAETASPQQSTIHQPPHRE